MSFANATSAPDWFRAGLSRLIGLLVVFVQFSCSPSRHIAKQVQDLSSKFSHHSGFVLVDPSDGKVLVNINGDKYFTPASNTKILTLFAGLSVLGDSIPAFRYRVASDSLIISGSGDPSFLYPETFTNDRALNFLKTFPGHIYLSPRNPAPQKFGPGWAWDDYDQRYQPERSEFPMYGNLVTIRKNETAINVKPRYFQDSVIVSSNATTFRRQQHSNQFLLFPDEKNEKTIQTPFITSLQRTAQLLSDTLKKTVYVLKQPVRTEKKFYGIPADSLYTTMMQKSDNLIAEQIIMMVADQLTDTLDAQMGIQRIVRKSLTQLPQPPVWIDGSGLSRYNQITPSAIAMIWKLILDVRKPEQVFPLLAASGRKGTLTSLNKGTQPFVFGKTGSLSNNYSLSGYLLTKNERLLIFSSMNANFTVPARTVRDQLERILHYIYEHY